MRWTAAKAIIKYRREKGDLTHEEFAGRLTVCESCPLRRANRCTAARQIITVLARRKPSNCPAGKWPGDALAKPKPAPRISNPQPKPISNQGEWLEGNFE